MPIMLAMTNPRQNVRLMALPGAPAADGRPALRRFRLVRPGPRARPQGADRFEYLKRSYD